MVQPRRLRGGRETESAATKMHVNQIQLTIVLSIAREEEIQSIAQEGILCISCR